MKKSRYNFVFSLGDGKFIAYNALRNGMALVDQPTAALIQEGGEPLEFNLDPALLGELKRGGFLLEDDEDEYRILLIRWRRMQFETSTLGLTIAPTLDCNLACPYCFETHANCVMDDATEDAIVRFAESYLKHAAKRLHVTWYGGEPMLQPDRVESLGGKLKTLCESNQASYSASMVTNGTCMTQGWAKRLSEQNLRSVQITLDGFREVHDRMRPSKDGSSSFDRIWECLPYLGDFFDVSIRVNVDRSNVDRALAFIRSIREEAWFKPDKYHVYLGYLRKETASCGCEQDEILKPGEFHRHTFEIQRQGVRSGHMEPPYPTFGGGCAATSLQGFVVGPKGDLYKCWNHIGYEDKSVGNVKEPLVLKGIHAAYLTESFENDEACRRCRYLPLCMGGCVDMRWKKVQGERSQNDCSEWKYYLEAALRQYFEYKMNKDS